MLIGRLQALNATGRLPINSEGLVVRCVEMFTTLDFGGPCERGEME